MRDILFLLKEKFEDGPGPAFFCPDCAEISGVLGYFPSLRHHLDIHYVDFARPRREIVRLLGEDHQNCPVLLLAAMPGLDAIEMLSGQANGRCFISGPRQIATYWAHVFGIPRPH